MDEREPVDLRKLVSGVTAAEAMANFAAAMTLVQPDGFMLRAVSAEHERFGRYLGNAAAMGHSEAHAREVLADFTRTGSARGWSRERVYEAASEQVTSTVPQPEASDGRG